MSENLATLNQKRWEQCKINPSREATFNSVAKRLTAPAAMARYKTVEAKTGVPWWFVAVVHEREASQNWNTQLGQGDPLGRKSTHVPKGRGPFKTWEEGAYDALVNCAPYASKNKDWSAGNALAMLEKYNGLGYYTKGKPSPYVWAGTNQYVKGKYVSDGVYNPNAVDSQLGCAGLLVKMGAFSKAPSAGPLGGALVGAGGAAVAASNYPEYLWPIVIGTAAVIAIGWGIYHWYQSRKTVNVD